MTHRKQFLIAASFLAVVVIAASVTYAAIVGHTSNCQTEQSTMQMIGRNFGQHVAGGSASGDLNKDGKVDIYDLSLELSRMQRYNCQ